MASIRLSRQTRLVRFLSSDGLNLEGRLTPGANDRAAVLCHPHPLHGGSMLTPVIMTAEQAFAEAGYTTLAFNFRGVGGSEGVHDEGRAEVGDVTGALDFLMERVGVPPTLQVVAGYSFGSVVGGRVAAADRRVRLYLGIAPPLNLDDFGFLRSWGGRVAFIAASHDEFCDRDRLETLGAALPRNAWLRTLDTNHFFERKLEELAQACRDVAVWAGDGETA